MIQKLKKNFKDQRGFTLIELLAVIVILGIIAAIAIPSILGLMNNSKLDAQVANAQQMVSSARNAVASNEVPVPGQITLTDLKTKGYIEDFTNPSDKAGGYDNTNSKVVITKGTGDSLIYTVTLIGNDNTFYVNNKASSVINRASVKTDSATKFTPPANNP